MTDEPARTVGRARSSRPPARAACKSESPVVSRAPQVTRAVTRPVTRPSGGLAAALALVLALVLALLVPAGVAAQQGPLKRLTLRQDLLGYEAVGRLDLGGGAFCTGTLIATDLVLTAAHCLLADTGSAARPLDEMSFRAGLADGAAIAQSPVRRAAIPRAYVAAGADRAGRVRNDAALVQLARPIASGQVRALGVADLGDRRDIAVVSYGQGRAEAPALQRRCGVLEHAGGLLMVDCDVTFGSSGAPVLAFAPDGRAQIVALISAGRREDAGTVAFGMDLTALLPELRDALEGARDGAVGGAVGSAGAAIRPGEATAPAPAAARPGVRHAGTARTSGARFLRPPGAPAATAAAPSAQTGQGS